MKNEIMSYFQATQMVDLATCEQGQPRLRPMTLIWYEGRFFFATGSADNKCAQIEANPRVEFCYLLNTETNKGYIRATGTLDKVSDIGMKKTIADHATYIYDYWSDPADEGYRLYEMTFTQVQYIKPGEMIAQVIDW